MTDEESRKLRFPREIEATQFLIDAMNQVTIKYEGKINLRKDLLERDLDLLISTMYGKASKSFEAITRLCCLGFGEDALVVLRANVNLMINFFYILSENQLERARNLIAYSHQQQKKYLRINHQAEPEWMEKVKWDEVNEKANRWGCVTIEERAKKAKQLYHYDTGYRFYSSIEHSDAVALSGYVEKWDEVGPKIANVPSDRFVSIALVHNFWTMSKIFLGFCSHFSIKEPEQEQGLDKHWNNLGKDETS